MYAARAHTQSYGGFMSSKVVEANAGIHSLAMAVAVRPVPTSSSAAVTVAQWKPDYISPQNPYPACHQLALVRYVCEDSFLISACHPFHSLFFFPIVRDCFRFNLH